MSLCPVVPHPALLSPGGSDKHPLDIGIDPLRGAANHPSLGTQWGGSTGCVWHHRINGREC